MQLACVFSRRPATKTCLNLSRPESYIVAAYGQRYLSDGAKFPKHPLLATACRRQSSQLAAVLHLEVPPEMSQSREAIGANASCSAHSIITPIILGHFLPKTDAYGKWAGLSRDIEALERETSTSDDSRSRLVDQAENENDIALWACLVNFAHRTDGDAGVIRVWQAVLARRKLRHVEGALGRYFWETVLNTALKDENTLLEVLLYAKWMLEYHSVKWPNLYVATIRHTLRKGLFNQTLKWHLRLGPRFAPRSHVFSNLIKEFATDPDTAVQDVTQILYISSGNRDLYDVLVPYLFQLGMSTLAGSWRRLLCHYGDLPVHATASRQYLRFLTIYFPKEVQLTAEETAVAALTPDQGQLQDSMIVREKMNRMYGDTFGIVEKPYNDSLGARWFASSWVPLDFAINAIHSLGVREIGPLSLQSIALREPDARGVAYRIHQLGGLDIGIGKSAYASALAAFARNRQETDLQRLLRSDIHPDVFEDLNTRHKILESSATRGDWKTYRLLLAVQLILSKDMATVAANSLLRDSLDAGRTRFALRLMDDMLAMGIQASTAGHEALSVLPFRDHDDKRHPDYWSLSNEILFYRRASALGTVFPLKAARDIISTLGAQRRMSEVEAFCLELIERYQPTSPLTGQSTVLVHRDDVPGTWTNQVPQRIPTDFPLRGKHPVAKLFNSTLQSEIVGWGFDWGLHPRRDSSASLLASKKPEDLSIARGVRLLRVLQGRSITVHAGNVRIAVAAKVARLYTPDGDLVPRMGVNRKRLVLEDIYEMVQKAWDGMLFSSLSQLREMAEAFATEPAAKGK